MKQSDRNHLRRLVGWVRCDIDQAPAEQQQTMIEIADQLGHPTLNEEAKARVVDRYRRAEAVPQYVRDAVKALEKMLAKPKDAAAGPNTSTTYAATAGQEDIALDPMQGTLETLEDGSRKAWHAVVALLDELRPGWEVGDAPPRQLALDLIRSALGGPDVSSKTGCLSKSADSEEQPAPHAEDVALPPYWQAFQFNSDWLWEQVAPSAADEPGVVKAYTADQLRAAIIADRQQRDGEVDERAAFNAWIESVPDIQWEGWGRREAAQAAWQARAALAATGRHGALPADLQRAAEPLRLAPARDLLRAANSAALALASASEKMPEYWPSFDSLSYAIARARVGIEGDDSPPSVGHNPMSGGAAPC